MCLMLSHDPRSVTPSLACHLLATEHHRQRGIHVRANQSPTSRVRLDAKALARYRAYNDHKSQRQLTRRLRGRLTAIPRGHQGALPASNPPGVLLHSQKPPVK